MPVFQAGPAQPELFQCSKLRSWLFQQGPGSSCGLERQLGDSPGIFNKRSAFKFSDSEHNSNQDSHFSRENFPPQSIES